MKNQLDHNQATYTPQQHKSFVSALSSFFENECPQLGGIRTRQVLVQSIDDMRRHFFPAATHMQPGQTIWTAVHKNARGAYGKSIAQTELTPVILDLVPQEEIEQRAKGVKLRNIKIEATARLFNQAYKHDGVLTNAEVAVLLKISPATVGKYVRQWENENGRVLPRRGIIHDMGPTLTHKKIIIHKLFIQHKTVENVARETNHSFEAIQRYIGTFRRVLLCKQKIMNTEQIANVLKCSVNLIREYEEIIDGYAKQNKSIEMLMKFHPEIR